MANKAQKKEFVLAQIAPYFKDPSTCGFDNGNCLYLTPKGNMCVAGKNLLHPEKYKFAISDILATHKQREIFKPEAVGILNAYQWQHLQDIHDYIATDNNANLRMGITRLNLFTYEELVEYSEKLT